MQDSSGRDRDCELLSFLVGTQEFCIDIMAVREIKGWTPTTKLPDSGAFVHGVINLRGAVLPIIDLAQRLSLGAAEPTKQHVIIVAQVGVHLVGLLVSAVCGILTVGRDAIHPPPDLDSGFAPSCLQGLIIIEDRIIGLLLTDQIIPDAARAA